MEEPTRAERSPAAWPSPLRFSATFFGVAVLLWFLWTARSIFVITFIGLLFGVAINPLVDRLQRFRIPRAVAAATVVFALLGVLSIVGVLLAPVLQEQGSELRQRIPQAIDRIDEQLARRHIDLGSFGTDPRNGHSSPLRLILSRQLGTALPYLFPFFSTALSALTGIILIIFLAIFFASDPLMYLRGVIHLVPHRHRPRGTALFEKMGHALRSWVVARSIAMVTIGLVVTATMAGLGIRAFVALGVIAGLLEFVPVFGPIVGAIPAIALGFVDSPQKALWVTIAFVVIQQLEGNVLIPILMQKAVEIPPALSLLGIAALAVVLGVLGALIAEPLVAALLVLVKTLYVEPVIGDHMGETPESA